MDARQTGFRQAAAAETLQQVRASEDVRDDLAGQMFVRVQGGRSISQDIDYILMETDPNVKRGTAR